MNEDHAQPPLAPPYTRRAGWRRVLAALTDAGCMIAILAVGSMVQMMIGLSQPGGPPGTPAPAAMTIVGEVMMIAFSLYTVSEVFWNRTVGKLAFGVLIVNMSGTQPGFRTRVARWANKWLWLVMYWGLLYVNFRGALFVWIGSFAVSFGGMILALGPKHRALHDLLTGTVALERCRAPRGFEVVGSNVAR
jgi:hypothetical protein